MKQFDNFSFSTDNLKDWIDRAKDKVKGDDDDYHRPSYGSSYDRPHRPSYGGSHYGEGHYDSGAPALRRPEPFR